MFSSSPKFQHRPLKPHGHTTEEISYPASLEIGVPTHISNLREILDHSWSAGIVDGCALVDNGDGTVSIGAGNAALRDSADPHTSLYAVQTLPQNNIALVDDATNYIILGFNAGNPTFIVSTSVVAFNGMDTVIAWVVHRKGILLHYLDARNINVDNARKASHMFLDFSRFIHAEGGSQLGSPSPLALSVTAGHFYFMLNEMEHPAFNTSIAGTANENVFILHTITAGVWTATEGEKLVDTTLYNDIALGPTVLSNNKFGVTWVYIVNDSPSELHVVMGQEEYPNLESARVASPPAVLPSIVQGLGSLIGFVLYEKAVLTFDNIYSAFTQSFTPGLAATHDGLSGLNVGDYMHLTLAEYNARCDIAHARRIATLGV